MWLRISTRLTIPQDLCLQETLQDIEVCRQIVKMIQELKRAEQRDLPTLDNNEKSLPILLFLEFKTKALLHDTNLDQVLKVSTLAMILMLPEIIELKRR